MSDAQAAQVTENGAPPTTQDKVEETGFKDFFTPFKDDILSIQIIMRGQSSVGYGFVALNAEEVAQKAVQTLNKKELDGRPVIVEMAKPADQKDKKERRFKRRPGRRGGKAVPGEVTEAEANGEAPKAEMAAAGTDEATKPKKKKKKPTRKPKAKPEAATEAEPGTTGEGEAVPAEPAPAAKRRYRRLRSHTSRPIDQAPEGEPSQNMLFVANLGFNIDDEGLAALFTEAGIPVVSARVVRRKYGLPRKSKGYGFVDVGNEAEQKKAIETLQGMEVGGRMIAVKIAVNTPTEDTQEEVAPADTTSVTPAPAA